MIEKFFVQFKEERFNKDKNIFKCINNKKINKINKTINDKCKEDDLTNNVSKNNSKQSNLLDNMKEFSVKKFILNKKKEYLNPIIKEINKENNKDTNNLFNIKNIIKNYLNN